MTSIAITRFFTDLPSLSFILSIISKRSLPPRIFSISFSRKTAKNSLSRSWILKKRLFTNQTPLDYWLISISPLMEVTLSQIPRTDSHSMVLARELAELILRTKRTMPTQSGLKISQILLMIASLLAKICMGTNQCTIIKLTPLIGWLFLTLEHTLLTISSILMLMDRT